MRSDHFAQDAQPEFEKPRLSIANPIAVGSTMNPMSAEKLGQEIGKIEEMLRMLETLSNEELIDLNERYRIYHSLENTKYFSVSDSCDAKKFE